MKSIANQTEEELGGPTSVLVRQRRDHAALDGLLHELAAISGEAEEELLTRLDRLVFSHAFAEETVLWPVLRSVLPDGDELTLQVEKEHQEVCEIVSALERDGAAHPSAAPGLRASSTCSARTSGPRRTCCSHGCRRPCRSRS
jgi:hypothetical protein